MNKVLILISVLVALFSNQLVADEISGGPRINWQSGKLTIPCVEVDYPESEIDDKFFDVKLNQNGDSYELIFVKEEDPEACKPLIEASLNADEDTSDVNGLNGSTAAPVMYKIGDTGPAGGFVFYIKDGGLHGMEAAPIDQSTGVAWGCHGISLPATQVTAVGTGLINTAQILAGCVESPIAADVVTDYSLNGYIDWFLPSKDELNLMYTNLHKAGLGGFADYFYWNSSKIWTPAV